MTEEFCVQYRCPPLNNDWNEFVGTRRQLRKAAEHELASCRVEEFNPRVEYRLAVRTVTDWDAA